VGDTCRECGHELRADARFCDDCGARVASEDARAEYKQVTVLFADVVHSMELAAVVGAERLRELMAELFDRSSVVVRRYGGTVDKFTGDGVMAVFGAPIALEDHAFRACLAALELQKAVRELGADVDRDVIALQLRVGLNSGEVIAGEIGTRTGTYTSVGEQVGMAQRMESVAPPGGVMISESTARLVEGEAVLGEPEWVHIKGASEPVSARRLVAAAESGRGVRQLSPLIGRHWELSTVGGMLDQSIEGKGRVVGLVGPPGIGKSRMVFEVTALAAERGVEVFTAACESHTSELPFYVVTRLLRAILLADGMAPGALRANIRVRMPEADPEDLVLLDDLLGIHAGETALPAIDPDARRRRLTVLLNTAAAARAAPAVYVIEDAHWIDEVSEAMLAEVAAVVSQTHSLMLITYRPEYRGLLDRLAGSHRIALAPLDDSESSALATELLGGDSSVAVLVETIAGRAAGNPFFAEEIIRDLAERKIVAGEPGAYVARADTADVRVPATLQAAIAARIDRLGQTAKRSLNAAAVIGSQFDVDLVTRLVTDVELAELVSAELVDQVTFTPPVQYAFRHPMIRTVAYESQLKADRAQLHRTLAAAIEGRAPAGTDANAALVAQHLEAAGELRTAYDWHMRAATWAQFRDGRAARTSWLRASDVADRLERDPNQTAKQIVPRTLLAVSTWRFSGSVEDTGFDELQALCASVGDNLSLGMGLAGKLTTLLFHYRFRESVQVATDSIRIFESIPDQALTSVLWIAAGNAKFQAGQCAEALGLAQRALDLADDDANRGDAVVGSPLALAYGLRGACRAALGMAGWSGDLAHAVELARTVDAPSFAAAILFKHGFPLYNGAFIPDATADTETAEALDAASRAGDDFAFDVTRLARGLVLVRDEGLDSDAGLGLLDDYGKAIRQHGYAVTSLRWVDTESARRMLRLGDVIGAIELVRSEVDYLYDVGDMTGRGPAVTVLVEALLQRGTARDLAEASRAIERLAEVAVDPGFVWHELPLRRMRALLARAEGDEAGYRDHLDRYRTMATALGYQGHIAIANAMG
jgi:adenylate cyclase